MQKSSCFCPEFEIFSPEIFSPEIISATQGNFPWRSFLPILGLMVCIPLIPTLARANPVEPVVLDPPTHPNLNLPLRSTFPVANPGTSDPRTTDLLIDLEAILSNPHEFTPGSTTIPAPAVTQIHESLNSPESLEPLEPLPELRPSDSESKRISYGVGTLLEEPTVLGGFSRKPTVLPGSDRRSVFPIPVYLQGQIRDNQSVYLELRGDPKTFGFDLSYTYAPNALPGEFSVNVFNQRSRYPAFEEGDQELNLPGGDDPYVHRLGGGLEYHQALAPALDLALGMSYQAVSVRDGLFGGDRQALDQAGNRLTVDNDGSDPLLTFNVAGLWDRTNDPTYATQGTRLRLGWDQALPIGDANLSFARLSGNASQFISLPSVIPSSEPSVLVLNLQTGTFIGDVPPYEPFNLGGSASVRGFTTGELGSGSSFVQTTLEYRFPLSQFQVRQFPVQLGGMVFLDYGTDLGTGDDVIGQPAEVRFKPGDALGYGLGLHLRTPVGLFRLEGGWNDQGGNEVHVLLGDRF
jgi:outer membrane protein insertion porin family